ncbi:MAG TPA: GNAT family N-acetyltransferase [Candidatus Acidoferrales bacterium]|nr:GNAT family N-acetyltransferase [Candidatus Acidoferrales bacterium]
MTIRRASAADVEQVADVLRCAFAEYERLYTRAGYAATTPDAAQLRARWDEGPVWVAGDGGIVATVAAVPRESGVYVRSMAVRPEARGSGAGRALMRELERYAIGERAPRMYLSSTPFLYDAIRLYEALGFRRTGEPPHDLGGTPLITLEKRLDHRA